MAFHNVIVLTPLISANTNDTKAKILSGDLYNPVASDSIS